MNNSKKIYKKRTISSSYIYCSKVLLLIIKYINILPNITNILPNIINILLTLKYVSGTFTSGIFSHFAYITIFSFNSISSSNLFLYSESVNQPIKL